MALRLSQPLSTAATRPNAAALPARASALLAARDVDGYLSLFAQAAEEPDVHRRYAARVHMLEAGLGVTGGSVHDTAQAFLAVAGAGLDLLEEEPREPIILNLTGVALYELGALAGARRLFEAAHRLDPELPHVRRNLREVATRRRSNRSVKLPAVVTGRLRPLESRTRAVAAAAQPATGLTLSLCMIVRDEEAMLGQCLAAVCDAVDEIIVVDTGSQDRTMEIAREYGAKVIETEWTGSFADARNVSFEAATGDWVMYLDADEVLLEGHASRLRALTGRTWREAFYVSEINHTGDIADGTAVTHRTLRVFRNRPEYRFEGRIHEQVAHRLPGFLPERIEPSDVRIEHFGYLGVVREAKDKSNRNLELLQQQVADGNDTPFLHFNLGSELSARSQHDNALKHFQRAWETVRENPGDWGFAPSLAARLALSLRSNGLRDEFERHIDEALVAFPGFTDLIYERAMTARMHGEFERARELLAECLRLGDAPDKYTASVGAGTYLPLCLLADIHRQEGELAEAEKLLRRSLEEHPRFLGPVEPLASVMLAQGTPPAEVVETVHATAGELTPAVHFLLAVPLYEVGAVVEAEAELREVLRRQPHSQPARVALAEALLSQRRYAEAAAEAAGVPVESPLAAAAARSELFARFVAGDSEDELAAALGRARQAGLPADEVTLFESWRALRTGGQPPRLLPAAAAGLLLAVLEALLRVGEGNPFVELLPLTEALPVGRRDRREQLAQLYLRRGLLDFAADEWAAACHEDGPDAPALAGLASIALARGNRDDAELFARTARELDPEHAGAGRVLARLES